ncbi:MAG: LytR/AlgR family response regulator transcription factor [Cyclobacteriaceae bacterium]
MDFKNRLLEPFPYYLQDDRRNLVLIAGISLFVVAFMYAFKTPGDHDLTLPQHFLFGGITFVCLVINIIALPKIFPAWFDQWTLGKYILINIGHLLLIGAASSLVDIFYICPHLPVSENLIQANSRVLIKGIIPIALTTLFLRNTQLQQNLNSALQANRELQKIQQLKTGPSKETNRITLYSETSDTLDVNLPDLLFIEADDNYSTVFWKSGQGIQRKLLRANLKNIENQLDNSFTLRCHRSFLVNINAIDSVSGNANGYKLKIRDTDIVIPVSRQKGKEVMGKIHQLRSMMELA